jgi:CBS domain-containing protein
MNPRRSLAPTAVVQDGHVDRTLRDTVARHAPFAQMSAADVEAFTDAATQVRFHAGDTVIEPGDGPVEALLLILSGTIIGQPDAAPPGAAAFEYEAGDLFPAGALLAHRPVTARYRAATDTRCLQVKAATVHALAAHDRAFASFLHQRVQQFLELSRRAMQAEFAAYARDEQSLEAPLASLDRKQPLACRPDAPLGEALRSMQERDVGSIVVTDERRAALGILTRHDVLGRVTLAGVALDAPIERVMSAPVHCLDISQTLQDAALLMSRRGVRHLPVTDAGQVVSIVSERDLFAHQRLSLRHLGMQLRRAPDVPSLQHLAARIPQLARRLVAQGLGARSLTQLISQLNDLLTERLVKLIAARHQLAASSFCWLSFGSEGRGEQTVATDQDNGIVFDSDEPDRDRDRWLDFGREVNAALDACGFPLCKGRVMAREPACCLNVEEWCARFEHWIEHGAPQDLLNASIFFDLRALAGNISLATPLRKLITERARGLPRFARQLAGNAMRNRAPLNWHGGIDTTREGDRDGVDLKLRGTTLFVDVARLYALAHGVEAVGTRQRLEAVAPLLNVPAGECASWVGAFEFLQMLRLRGQIGDVAGRNASGNPNWVALEDLNEIDRRVLKEVFRIARRLQQRIELDWLR